MKMNNFNLDRFVEAQEGIYPVALQELKEGRKRSHWIWFVFPQLKGLGRSFNANYYGLDGREEAGAYLDDPILGSRLREASETLLALPTSDAEEVMGGIDAMKLRSSMTLFDLVSPDDVFDRVLDKFYDGKRDNRTLRLVGEEN